MSGLPDGWRWTVLDELKAEESGAITDGPFGSKLTSAHYSSDGARVVRLQNIGEGIYRSADAFIPWSHFEDLRKHEVRANDLLIASLGEDPPRACLAPENLGEAIVKADCIRVRLSDDVDPRWVMYGMQSPALKRWAAEQLHGVGRPRLGLQTIRALPLPFPPYSEQRRIVDLLEDHLSRLDASHAYLQRSQKRLDTLHQAVLTRELQACGNVTTSRVRELLRQPITNGRSVPSRDGGFPVLRLTAIKDDGIDLGERKAGAWTEDEAQPFLVQQGDFLLARGNGSLRLVGRGALVGDVPNPVAYPDTVMRLRFQSDAVDARYVAFLWRSPVVRRQIESQARTTAGIYKINQGHLNSIEIPLPPMADQCRVVSRVADVVERRRRLGDTVGQLQHRRNALRRALLAAAFSGRLTGHRVDTEVVGEFAAAGV